MENGRNESTCIAHVDEARHSRPVSVALAWNLAHKR